MGRTKIDQQINQVMTDFIERIDCFGEAVEKLGVCWISPEVRDKVDRLNGLCHGTAADLMRLRDTCQALLDGRQYRGRA